MSKITDYGFLFQQMLGTKNAKNARPNSDK